MNSFETIFYKISQDSSIGIFNRFSVSDFPRIGTSFRIVGNDGNEVYFDATANGQARSIWKTDLTEVGTDLVIYDEIALEIIFEGDSFFLKDNRGNTKIGKKSNPQALKKVVLAPGTSPETRIISVLDHNKFILRSLAHGYELGYANGEGEIVLFEDLRRGHGSSFLCYWYNCDLRYSYLPLQDGKWMAFMTNGNDDKLYLYYWNGQRFISLFPLDDPENTDLLYVEGDYLFFSKHVNNRMEILRWDMRQTPVSQPAAKSPSPTWFRQIQPAFVNDSIFFESESYSIMVHGMEPDLEGNLIISGSKIGFGTNMLMFSDTSLQLPMRGSDFLAKYDTLGNVLWAKTYGNGGRLDDTNPSFTVDQDGNIIFLSSLRDKGFFGPDSVVTNTNSWYLVKLDGATGNVLWKQRLANSNSSNHLLYEAALTTDDKRNIYFTFFYQPSLRWFMNQALNPTRSPQIAIASFTPKGTLRYVKNLEIPHKTKYNHTSFISYNALSQTLILAHTGGYFNVWSSCKFSDWEYSVQTLDLEGNILNDYLFTSDDLGALTTGALLPDGSFIGTGYYRGTINFGKQNWETGIPGPNRCNQVETFIFRRSTELHEVMGGYISSDFPFFPIHITRQGDTLYAVGSIDDNYAILKMDLNGMPLAIKRLSQSVDLDGFISRTYIQATPKFLTIYGSSFTFNAEMGIIPPFAGRSTAGLLRMENNGWEDVTTDFVALPFNPDNFTQAVTLYPNPTNSREIKALFVDPAIVYDRFEIISLQGQVIARGRLTGESIEAIQLPPLTAGMYLVRFNGGENSVTARLVVE